MILGSCPYEDCDEPLMLPIADVCPAFQKHTCEGCKRVIWTKHSRIDPESYTEEGFTEVYEVDETTKKISTKTNQ